MLTDLHLSGHLQDADGRPCAVGAARPADPVLRRALDEVGTGHAAWTTAAAHDQRIAPTLVCSQLEADGWLSVRRRRVLGIARTTRVLLRDDRMVSRLADRVAATLRDGIAGRPTDERLLAIGLIGALGELPTVFDFVVATRHYRELEELVHQAIPPIRGMRDVIVAVHSRMRAIENGPWST